MPATLDRFRTALKFSLWAWALYWPGGGLLLMGRGLDLLSIGVTAGCLVVFVALMAGGTLRTTSSRTVRELFLERPLYLVGALAALIGFATLLSALENVGLLAFSAVWLAAVGLVAVRLRVHLRESGLGAWAAKADQAFAVFGAVGIAAYAVFLDAFLQMLDGASGGMGLPAPLVAVCTWLSLLYPPMVLVATKPFREPLSFRRQAKPAAVPVPDVVPAKA